VIMLNNLCLGTVQFGLNYGIANKTGRPATQEISKIITTALDNGIQYFDTAQAYGESEALLGEIFEELSTRTAVKLITKLTPDFQHTNADQLRRSIDSSLTRLKMSSLWGLMTHRSSSVTDWERFSKNINSFESGKLVQHFGVSLYSPEEAMEFLDNEFVDIIQIPTNILDKRLIENGFFERAVENNKTIFIRSVFLQGLLLLNESELENGKMKWVKEHLQFYYNFLRKHDLLPQYFTLKAIRQRFPELILVSGVETQSQLLDNLELLKAPDLKQSILNEWWSNLPDLPNKLLDPSKWST
jgi:aryl-alcohol dehydrogenase-like predicted oxidoreductase